MWKLYQSKKAGGASANLGPQQYGHHYEPETPQQYEYPAPAPAYPGQVVPHEVYTPPSELYTEPPYSELAGSQKPVEAPGVTIYR